MFNLMAESPERHLIQQYNHYMRDVSSTCHRKESNTKLNAYHDGTVTDGDDDLKAYLDENVSSVDFEISHGELTLELNCGGFEWKPVDVLTPRSRLSST